VLRIAFLPRHQPFFSLFVFLFKMIMALQTGQTAPDFTLFNSDKKEVSLSALRGSNVLLLFFPLAFTSVCTAELCAVRDNLEQYNKANAKVLGISVDSPYTLAKFKEEQRLKFVDRFQQRSFSGLRRFVYRFCLWHERRIEAGCIFDR
jgi:cytochrome oxidase Cu insertion factor (SCO1/SenC/PrrC family)